MEALGVVGFVFGLSGCGFGIMAYLYVNKLVNTLKEKGILDKSYSME